jgi:hypothetical protein
MPARTVQFKSMRAKTVELTYHESRVTLRIEWAPFRYSPEMRPCLAIVAAALCVAGWGCDETVGPDSPSASATATIRIVFVGPTTRRADLPASAQECANAVGVTHTHPSWRSFASIPLQPVPPDRYEISFSDVPTATRVSFRVNDQNSCDENSTGAVTRNVLVNDIRLIQNTTTPGNGDEPGFAFAIARDGRITQ